MDTIPHPDPRQYSIEDVAALSMRVLLDVSQGDTLTDALAVAGVHHATWWQWTEDYDWIAAGMTRARIVQAHSLADRAVKISRAVKGEDYNIVQAVRLEVDTIKWYTSKIAPRLYGDQLEITGNGIRIGVIALPAEKPPTSDAVSRVLQSGDAPESGANSVDPDA